MRRRRRYWKRSPCRWRKVSTVRNIDGLNSWTRNGNGGVFIRFKRGTDMDVYQEVRDRVELPGCCSPKTWKAHAHKRDMSGIPLMAIGVIVDTNLSDVYNLIQKDVIRRCAGSTASPTCGQTDCGRRRSSSKSTRR